MLILAFLSIILNNLSVAPEAVTIFVNEELIEDVELAKELVYKITEANYPEVKSLFCNTKYPPNHNTLNVAKFATNEFVPL